MNIVFWGMERECGMTVNMLTLANYLVLHKGCRVTLFELVAEKRGVCTYFPEPYQRYRKAYLETLIEKQLYYVSGERWKKCQRKRKTRKGKEHCPPILETIRYVESNMDAVLVNLGNRRDKEARKLMWEADLLVVNLKQNERVLETFFAHYANLSERIFFLIGKYFGGGVCDEAYFKSKYRIPEEQLAVIPFNSELTYICEKSRIDHYIRHDDDFKISGMKYYFLREVEKTAEKMYEFTFPQKNL